MPTPVGHLKQRSEFLRVANARHKWVAPGLVLQVAPYEHEKGGLVTRPTIRVGFTASRRVGNAVKRNRAKRRLRGIAQRILSNNAKSCTDYVLIARAATLNRPADRLADDLITALKKLGVHQDVDSIEVRKMLVTKSVKQ